MEVASESEAIEYCEYNGLSFEKCYEGKGSNAGKLMMLAYDNSNITPYEEPVHKEKTACKPKQKVKDSVVFCHFDGGYGLLYVADRKKTGRSVTFQISEAQLFEAEKARAKASSMRKNGHYDWTPLKVKVKV